MSKTIAHNSNVTCNENDLDVIKNIQTNLVDLVLNSAGLVIGSSSKKKVKLANAIHYLIDGVLYTAAGAEVALTATTHNVAAGKFAAFLVLIDAAGTVTFAKSADAASLAAVVLPAVPADNVVVGIVIINPTGTGNFVAATTDLDDATVVPNAVYINTNYPFNPNSLAL